MSREKKKWGRRWRKRGIALLKIGSHVDR